jgi:hypothetical protein
MALSSDYSPKAIKSKTTKGLERAMMMNNFKYGAFFQYQISWDGKEWVAWYYMEAPKEMMAMTEGVLRGDS